MSRKGFLQQIRSFFVAPRGNAATIISTPTADFGVHVNSDSALKFTAVFAAIKILSENIASLPKSVKVKTDKGFVSASDHALYPILSEAPNEYTDIFTFWFTIISSMLQTGNAYAKIEFKDGVPVALHQINPNWVNIQFVNGKKLFVVKHVDPDFKFLEGTYLNHEILHFMLFSLDGIVGIDPITYNAGAIGRGLATQAFAAEFYKKGGNIKGVLETDGSLGDEAFNMFMEHYRNSAKNYETPLLEYGIKYKPIGISPIAAQLIQSEVLSIQDIARIFSIPPHLLAELTHATFSNIEHQNIFFAKYSLRPICKRIEQQLENKLLTSAERMTHSIKFDMKGYMRGDDAARSTYYREGINAGWLTRNEARELEELAKIDGLDKPLQPLNMVEVGQKIDN